MFWESSVAKQRGIFRFSSREIWGRPHFLKIHSENDEVSSVPPGKMTGAQNLRNPPIDGEAKAQALRRKLYIASYNAESREHNTKQPLHWFIVIFPSTS